MNKFIVSDWFKNRANLNIQVFDVEGIEFELMALSESLIDDVKSCESYEEMIATAADYGISYERKRVMDDTELSKDLDLLWGLESLDLDLDPCIKYRVGEKVCEISGLKTLLDEILEAEKLAALVIDGDNLIDTDITLGELQSDADEANKVAA